MQEKIFNALKQEYSRLGLGDEVLMAHAAALNAMGLVTDENLQTVVKAQETFLSNLQKANDRRAADAAKKAKEDEAKRLETEWQKKLDDQKKDFETQKRQAAEEALAVAKKAAEDADRKKKEEDDAKKNAADRPEWFRTYQEAEAKRRAEEKAAFDKIIDDLRKTAQKEAEEAKAAHDKELKDIRDKYAQMEAENKKNAEEKRIADRNAFIASKAAELQIPDYRIKEGFAISSDMDETAITSYLTTVAGNIKANLLPAKGGTPLDMSAKPTEKEIGDLAADLIK